jgi:hypothetical protein
MVEQIDNESCCLSYCGDQWDWYIGTILGHHPACDNFQKEYEGELPSYHYKVNFCNVVKFLSDTMFVRQEYLMETAKKFMSILELTEGQKVYLDKHVE